MTWGFFEGRGLCFPGFVLWGLMGRRIVFEPGRLDPSFLGFPLLFRGPHIVFIFEFFKIRQETFLVCRFHAYLGKGLVQ